MIPAIGFMIGFYILTRMMDLIATPDRALAVKIFAWITILVAVFSMLDIVTSAGNATDVLGR